MFTYFTTQPFWYIHVFGPTVVQELEQCVCLYVYDWKYVRNLGNSSAQFACCQRDFFLLCNVTVKLFMIKRFYFDRIKVVIPTRNNVFWILKTVIDCMLTVCVHICVLITLSTAIERATIARIILFNTSIVLTTMRLFVYIIIKILYLAR